MTATPARLARVAMYDAITILASAEQAIEADDLAAAERLAEAARTAERIAEFYAGAAMLGKDGRPRE